MDFSVLDSSSSNAALNVPTGGMGGGVPPNDETATNFYSQLQFPSNRMY